MDRRDFLKAGMVAMVAGAALPEASAGVGTRGESIALKNNRMEARFDNAGLARLTDLSTGAHLDLQGVHAVVRIDGRDYDTASLKPAHMSRHEHTLAFSYESGGRQFQVLYELRPNWGFVTKQIILTLPADAPAMIENVTVVKGRLLTPVAQEQKSGGGSRGVFLRIAGSPNSTEPTHGAFLVLQNPFMQWDHTEDGSLAMSYDPQMAWQSSYGPFESDRACIGLYCLSGYHFPADAIPEWQYLPAPQTTLAGRPWLDVSEIQAMQDCVAAFSLVHRRDSARVHIGWCENDYQIDAGTEAGRVEYKRIIDRAAEVGCQYVLYTPANSTLSSLKDNTDAWGWENVLWLGLGQQIRDGKWDIDRDPIPPSIQEMLDYARSRHVKLMAYVYPSLIFKQHPEWAKWAGEKAGGYLGSDTGLRPFQDWLVDRLAQFRKRTGIAGFSFDYWWIAYDPPASSKYAQWHGCRRILNELRRQIPNVVIDGRQQYQWFGAWTWVAGSYPHPMSNDEQPESFKNFPDLHFDRVSANRERFAAYWYRTTQFCPVDLMPGYMTHQTQRYDATGACLRTRFRPRDWDLLGWRYSVISSISVAPFNHVINMLPARDEAEFKAFSPEDARWFRHWLDWTDQNRDVLGHLRPIIGQPMVGQIDGSAACVGDHGFVFLINPNYPTLNARFALDASIGLDAGRRFIVRELYPRAGVAIGRPGGAYWQWGDTIDLPIKGPQAIVLEVAPASAVDSPMLFNAAGRAVQSGSRLDLLDVAGEPGARLNLAIAVLDGESVREVHVNGRGPLPFSRAGDAITVPVQFAGQAFGHCQQVGHSDMLFTGAAFSAKFSAPQRVFAQLANRKKNWPVPYTEDDRLATWLASYRLLLFVQIADPSEHMAVSLKIDGRSVNLTPAFGSVYPQATDRTFLGFYADLSHIQPEQEHEVLVDLPALKPGQFQGLFFENVEAAYTTDIL